MEVALDLIETLTQGYGKDAEITAWIDTYDIWVVPMVNPDGNARVWSGSTMWRKNARGGHGVDINRNYATDWAGCNGSSGNKDDNTYRGTSPLSEPESKALSDFAGAIRPTLNLSYHSFSELVLYPMGCSPKRVDAEHRVRYESVGKKLASLLVRDSGSGTYSPGTPYELLYNADGGSLDHMYRAHGILSYVVEINGGQAGFQPPFSYRKSTVERQRAGWKYILREMENGPLD